MSERRQRLTGERIHETNRDAQQPVVGLLERRVDSVVRSQAHVIAPISSRLQRHRGFSRTWCMTPIHSSTNDSFFTRVWRVLISDLARNCNGDTVLGGGVFAG